MIVNTSCNRFSLALATAGTTSSFTVPSISQWQEQGRPFVVPTGFTEALGYHEWAGENGYMGESIIELFPFGTGSDEDQFSIQIHRWKFQIISNITYLVPVFVCELACTLGTAACTQLLASGKSVDTITLTTGNASGVRLTSPAGNERATVAVDILGANYVSTLFAKNGGSATAMNALYSKVS